jgi:hypothetical protein
MVVNFRARGISRGARKLARTPTLNKKKKKRLQQPAERQNRLNLSEDEGCWNKMCIQLKHAASNTAQNISWDHHSVSFSLDMLSSSKR